MIAKRTIGLNFTSENTADLQVWAPLALSVKISINNDLKKSLHKELHGFWELDALRIHPGDKYQLIIDDIVLTDPVSLFQPDGVHSPSVAFNLNRFRWTDKHWTGIPPQELIIYELHTGTFTEEGTFDGIISQLDYLKELGVTAIELMPVAQFPGDRNWGYDGVYPFAVQNSYGGPERLQHLVDACHKKGLAVILDVVYNHLGPEGNYLPAFGPVFTDKYKTPWGQAINFDDEWSNGIRKIVIENVLMWFRDFHIDGLRLDAIHAIKDFSAQHILQEIRHHVSELNIFSSRNHFLIGESDLNDIKVISPFERGGFNLDATWCDEFHHSLHAFVTGEKNGYYSDFGKIEQIAKTLNDAYVYDGIWTEHRKRKFGNKTTGIPGHKFVVFTQNHDQVGNRMMGDRLSTNISFEMLKLVAGTMLLSPFIPMLFMGEEYGETNPFLYFTSHSDHDLIRAVREGRKNEFKAFMSEGEAPDPQAIETFFHSKLNWNKRTEKQAFMLNFYKELIHLRKTLPALRITDRQEISAEVFKNKNAIILTRKSPGQQLIAVLNFEPSEINIEKEVKGFELILNSADEKWGGSNHSATKATPSQSVTLWLNP